MKPPCSALFALLCALAGVPAPAASQGKSLRPVLNDPKGVLHEGAFTNLPNDPTHAGMLKELRAVLAAKLPPIAK